MNESPSSSMPDDSAIIGDLDDMASQVVDGSLTTDEIPEAVRTSVLARAAVFEGHRRSLLRIDTTVDENQIDTAVAAYRRLRSRRLPRALGVTAAAASFLMLSGLVITQFASNDSNDMVTSDAESAVALAATDESALDGSGGNDASQASAAKAESAPGDSTANGAPPALYSDDPSEIDGEIIDIDSVSELEQLTSTARLEELARESARDLVSPTCITDGSQRLITRRARFQGIPVEIYQVPSSTSAGVSSGELNVFSQSDCSLVARSNR